MVEDCIFCKIACGEIKVEIIHENDNFLSFPDVNPQTEGHSLVISKKHFDTFLDLPSSLGSELIDCIKNTSLKLMQKNNSGGFNILNNNFPIAGQIVKHLHFHILPRKKGSEVGKLY